MGKNRLFQEAILRKIRKKNDCLCATDDYDEAMMLTATIKALCEILREMAAGINAFEVRRELEAIASIRPKEVIAGGPGLPYGALEETIRAL